MSRQLSILRHDKALMRFLSVATVIVISAAVAAAQSKSKFELGAVVRSEHVSIEGGAGGNIPVAGISAKILFTRTLGLYVDLTKASGQIERSYEGQFISFATGPNATREEIERLAPIARRSLTYIPGVGVSLALTAQGEVSSRVSLALLVGFAIRDYRQTTTHEILYIPEEVDPALVAGSGVFADTSRRKRRGGLLFGLEVPIILTRHVSVSPEIRYVYGGPAKIGNKHREFAAGANIRWSF